MVKVTVTGTMVVLVSDPEILPDPLAAIPGAVPVLSRVQLNIVPLTLPVNAIVVITLPEHMACVEGLATALGTGLTVTVAVVVAPVQATPPEV